jgi:hypothetical protein
VHSELFLNVDYIHTWIQTISYAVCAVLAARRAVLHPDVWRYKILTGAFLSYVLGDLFWILYFTIKREYALFFSAADLSWIAVNVFLITAGMNIINELNKEQSLIVRKFRVPAAVISAAVVISTHTLMVWIAGGLFNNICYGIVYFLLVYFSLLLFFAGRKGVLTEMKQYHGAIILMGLLDILMFLFSCFWETEKISMAFDMGLTLIPFLILHVMKKELRAGITSRIH